MSQQQNEPQGVRVLTPADIQARNAQERLEAAAEAAEHAEKIRAAKKKDIRIGMTLQALAFHVLSPNIPGVSPWEPLDLYKWICERPPVTGATYHAVRFLLCLWNRQGFRDMEERASEDEFPLFSKKELARLGEPLGEFDAMEALASWDRRNRAAFVAWCRDPWWP